MTPAFLVRGTSVMCNTMMLALWVWAVLLWMRGLENENFSMLIFASLLIAACALTKYYGKSLIPLLLIYSLIRTRRLGRWALYLLIPVFILDTMLLLGGTSWLGESGGGARGKLVAKHPNWCEFSCFGRSRNNSVANERK